MPLVERLGELLCAVLSGFVGMGLDRDALDVAGNHIRELRHSPALPATHAPRPVV